MLHLLDFSKIVNHINGGNLLSSRANRYEDLVASKSQIENIITYDSTFNPKTTMALSVDLDIKTVTGKGSAEITSYTPGQVKIITKTNQDEILILADQYEDGWKAEIDGNNTKISRANLIFRAIKVPSGIHRIIFTYYPKSFDIGLKIAIVSLFFIFILSIYLIKRKQF